MQLYIGGSLEVNETNITIDTSRTLSAGNVKLVADSSGKFFFKNTSCIIFIQIFVKVL